MKTPTTLLESPYKLTDTLTLKNRIVMAPMTRVKATDTYVPTSDMVTYYSKRADAGLIITEGTIISTHAKGHHHVPGIFSKEHIKGWRNVTDAVHTKGGRLVMQLWHVGRVSHPTFLDGQLPLSASATTMSGKVNRIQDLYYGDAREASLEDISQIIQEFAHAATNAMEAGFDGVELHGANGYLIDQFLHYNTNLRTDPFGETPENMAKFALDIIDACAKQIGYHHIGIRLSPGAYLNEIKGDARDAAVFRYLLSQLNQRNIAYVHEGNFDHTRAFPEFNNMTMSEFMRPNYQGTLIGCGSYTLEQAENALQKDLLDLVAFGRPFIANPDLIQKINMQQTLQPYHVDMLNTLI